MMIRRPKFGQCELCLREVSLTFHHLIPKKLHKRKRFAKRYNKEELNSGVMLCRQCHKGVHKLYDESTLGSEFNSLALLKADVAVGKHISWVKRQKS